MNKSYTLEYINSISPDKPSMVNAQKIFSKTVWEIKSSSRGLWTEIKGSSKTPYLVAIDQEDLTFKCNCPSRKFPCKHSLAFGLYLSSIDINTIAQEDEPQWVQEWLDKRSQKKKKIIEVPQEAPTKEDIEKKFEQKFEQAIIDISFLEQWLQDSIASGLIEFINKTTSDWERLQKRMVDFKISGINTILREFQEVDYNTNGWENDVLVIIAKLNLLIQAIKQHKSFTSEFKAEFTKFLGWSVTKKQLLVDEKSELIDDYWVVFKVYETKQEDLTIRKVYLYGTTSKRWAYILEFAHGASYFEDFYKSGSLMQAKLIFYDGILKLQAFIKVRGTQSDDIQNNIEAFESLENIDNFFQEKRLLFPWIFEYPMLVNSCNIVFKEKQFFLMDKDDYILPLIDFTMDNYMKLLASSLGEIFSAFFTYENGYIRLMSIYQNNKVVSI